MTLEIGGVFQFIYCYSIHPIFKTLS
jgi:hypothetical protein